MVGLRTSKYKYFRAARNLKENVNIYDLRKDPQENNNIAKNHPLIVKDMEKILSEISSYSSKELEPEEISKDEEEKIRKELKKLGYM
jgi:hypothetical protein